MRQQTWDGSRPAQIENIKRQSLPYFQQAEAWYAELGRDYAAAQAKFNKAMCEKCKVDAQKTTFPKGYVDGYSFLFIFGSPAQSEEEGIIQLQNGERITWKFIYGDDYKIETAGEYPGKYDSIKQMIDDVIDRCNQRWR